MPIDIVEEFPRRGDRATAVFDHALYAIDAFAEIALIFLLTVGQRAAVLSARIAWNDLAAGPLFSAT